MTNAEGRPGVQRLGAYAVCVNDGAILLSRFTLPDGRWGPPGGGVNHGEHAADGCVREVSEETGYRVRVVSLLGVHSNVWHNSDAEVHATNLVYEVAMIGGELRHETDGSSDQAAWMPLARIKDLRRTALLDAALDLHRWRPQDGRCALAAEREPGERRGTRREERP